MRKLIASIVLLLIAASAAAQPPARLRGTITALEGDVLTIQSRDGRALRIQLAPELGVSVARASSLEALRGRYVGATAINKDGRMVALEVHVLPPTAAAGHTPWDLEPGTTMTNAVMETVAQVTGGNEITMEYKTGRQTILVPPGTPIVDFAPGSRADLKPGETIFAAARQEGEGRYSAARISVSRDGVRPPQ